MMWNGDGSWGWWWLPALFMFVVCMVMMARMMSHGGHRSHAGSMGERGPYGPQRAERILADRLARGEIDIEEYERRLAVLHDSRQPERP